MVNTDAAENTGLKKKLVKLSGFLLSEGLFDTGTQRTSNMIISVCLHRGPDLADVDNHFCHSYSIFYIYQILPGLYLCRLETIYPSYINCYCVLCIMLTGVSIMASTTARFTLANIHNKETLRIRGKLPHLCPVKGSRSSPETSWRTKKRSWIWNNKIIFKKKKIFCRWFLVATSCFRQETNIRMVHLKLCPARLVPIYSQWYRLIRSKKDVQCNVKNRDSIQTK